MNTFKRTLALMTATVFLASGCAQLKSVPLARSDQGMARPAVEAGQNVVVTTKDGAKHRFQVTSVEKDALRGEHDLIAYSDMQSLQVRNGEGMKFSKTALIIGAVVVGAAVIGAAGGGGGSGGGY